MGEPKGKFASENICCLGISHMGLLVSTAVAYMSPSVTVTVVDLQPEKITLWNTKQISLNDSKLEEMLKLSQNRNLVFSTNAVSAIKAADIIFISLDSTCKTQSKNEKVLDLTDIEEAIRLIAKVSENDKIIAVRNTVPVGTNRVLKKILNANKTNGVDFQVLSFPESLSSGDVVSSYLNPDKILLGSDLSQKGSEASEKLASVFSWVPPPKIVKLRNKSAELTKIIESAIEAQKTSNMRVMSLICEKVGADVSEIFKILGKSGENFMETSAPAWGFGTSHLKKHLTYLVQLCEKLNLNESADYWRLILTTNENQEKRFFKKILTAFYNNLIQKKIAVWGLECNKNYENPSESLATDLCRNLVLEGAKVNVYEPKKEKRQLMNELKTAGLEENKDVIYCEDPYKAARKADAIVVLSNFEDLNAIDFNEVYREMGRPAHLFDGPSSLPHQQLIQIGFHVETNGKRLHQNHKISIF